ncbi:MAG: glutamate--tRNA ligase, partial [Rhodobacteraceae bacterium]|nr:glutamate--tRNA ligase [Paracoccaceae bacterium]
LLRADGTPTYMLSVVVDDIGMGITHVIRGDDHFTNAFRQSQLIAALGHAPPTYAHIPLIHGPDGAKLSKRHGALGVEAYRDMGLLPEALRNYLLRLGWGHGDDEIISDAQAIEWFDVRNVGRNPARFDMAKLTNLNGHYIRESSDAHVVASVAPWIEKKIGRVLTDADKDLLTRGMAGLKQRAKTLIDLADSAAFYVLARPLKPDEKAAKMMNDGGRELLISFVAELESADPWSAEQLESWARAIAEQRGLKLGQVAQPLRIAISGSTVSPPVFEVLAVLGKSESLARIRDAVSGA